MIDLKEIYTSAEVDDIKYFEMKEFECEHCKKTFTEEGLNIAVFLYGIFFLTNPESGYAGITCPSCLKTLLMKGDRELVDETFRKVATNVKLGDITNPNVDLRYNSSIHYCARTTPIIYENSILNLPLSDADSLDITISMVISYEDDNNLIIKPEHFRSYYGYTLSMKPDLTVWWFNEEQILKLYNFENEKKQRVFPRYVYNNTVFEEMDCFCFKYYLNRKRLVDQIKEKKVDIRALKKSKNVYSKEVFQSLIDDAKKLIDLYDFALKQYDEKNDFDILIAPSDFLNILRDNPYPWDLPVENNLRGLWKTKHPFKGAEIPEKVNDIDLALFKNAEERNNHEEMLKDIRAVIAKRYVQEFLFDNYMSFIKDYFKIAKQLDYSYALLWRLKEKYLKRLHGKVMADNLKRPDQKDKDACQKMGLKFWRKGPSTIKAMANRKEIVDAFGCWAKSTRYEWLREVWPKTKQSTPRKKKD